MGRLGVRHAWNHDRHGGWRTDPGDTGFGHARNIVIIHSSDGVIAIAGSYGTLSEIAFASKLNIPLVGISTWGIDVPMTRAGSPEEALEELYSKI